MYLELNILLILTYCELQFSAFLWSFKLSVTFVTVAVLITVHFGETNHTVQLVFSISSIQYRDKNCYCTDSFITRCQCGNWCQRGERKHLLSRSRCSEK